MKNIASLAKSGVSLAPLLSRGRTSSRYTAPFALPARRHTLPPVASLAAGRIHTLLAWAGICLILSTALWTFTWFKLESEKDAITRSALTEATYLSQSYAEQLSRSIEQIDQITLHLQYQWQASGGVLNLAPDTNPGIYPLLSKLQAWVTNHNGTIISSSAKERIGTHVGSADYFLAQQHHPNNGFYIGNPSDVYLEEDAYIHFSRRLNHPDGRFAGVITLAATPAYLASFTSELALGSKDSVTLKKLDGTLLSSKRGSEIRDIPTIYRSPSVFAEEKGVLQLPAESFIDDEARIVAWHKLKNYPLMSMVNRAESEVFTAYREIAQDYRLYASLGTLALLALCIVGISLTSSLARKRKQASDIRYTYRLATEAAQEGFFTVKAIYGANQIIEDFIIEDCNDRGAHFIGFAKPFVIGKRFSEIYLNEKAQRVLAVFRGAMQTGFYEDELKLPGREKPLWINRRLVRFEAGLAVTLRDISEAKFHELELAKLAHTDALTGLPNRYWLRSHLPAALEQAKKTHTLVAVLFIDLDEFKDLNDSLGHETGDELLKAAAVRIQAQLRPGDHLARLGGDEFTVITELYENRTEVIPLAERIIASLSQPIHLGRDHIHVVGASIGISFYQEDGLDPDTLLKHADTAMYAAKANGKGRYQFYQPHMTDRLLTRLDNEKALRSAMVSDEFVLLYQPKVSMATGAIQGLEALVRWKHPLRGTVSPSEFIPFAEESGLIVDLGPMILDKACRQIAQWLSQGLPVVPVSVNVSACQLNTRSLLAHLERSLQQSGVPPSLLEIELTESSMVSECLAVREEIEGIKRLGIKLAIDDFGTGYSSMSQLQRLDMDILKIDQSFTRRLTEGAEGEAFFRAMISMAHALGIEVIAEGLETEQQFAILRALSCDQAQGFYISQPVAPEHVRALLMKRILIELPLAVDLKS